MSFDPWRGERMPIAWEVVISRLSHGEWANMLPIVTEMSQRADILTKSAANMLSDAIGEGIVQKKGRYVPISKRKDENHDGRQIRLSPVCPGYFLQDTGGERPGDKHDVECPACGKDSIYILEEYHYFHSDGSDNRACWKAS